MVPYVEEEESSKQKSCHSRHDPEKRRGNGQRDLCRVPRSSVGSWMASVLGPSIDPSDENHELLFFYVLLFIDADREVGVSAPRVY